MSFLLEVVAWLTAPEHWVGSDGIPNRIGEHLLLSGVTALVAVLIALPLGVFFGHTGRGGFLAINLANIGRALPSLALLALMLPLALSLKLGLGFWPTFMALVPLGHPAGADQQLRGGARSRSRHRRSGARHGPARERGAAHRSSCRSPRR